MTHTPLTIGLSGYGKMGQLIELLALKKGHSIAWSSNKNKCMPKKRQEGVIIDFSHPSLVYNLVCEAIERNTPLVIGTSGWYQDIEKIKSLVEKSSIGVLYAHNFSIGVNLFFEAAKSLAKLMNSRITYDPAITESHHREKADAPSGTAIGLANIVLEHMDRKTRLQTIGESPIAKEAISISSSRVGTVPGTHTLLFDSATDTIELTHRSHSRESFAKGALLAAEWIVGKQGFFSIQDML